MIANGSTDIYVAKFDANGAETIALDVAYGYPGLGVCGVGVRVISAGNESIFGIKDWKSWEGSCKQKLV